MHAEIEWRKCPSVTTGGKPFFWKAVNHELWVVWDRYHEKWALKDDTKTIGFYPDPETGRRAGKEYLKQQTKGTEVK